MLGVVVQHTRKDSLVVSSVDVEGDDIGHCSRLHRRAHWATAFIGAFIRYGCI